MNLRERLGLYLKKLTFKKRKNLVERFLVFVYLNYKKLKSKLLTTENLPLSRLYLRAKDLGRRFRGQKYNFVTVGELVIWTNEWVKSFPRSFDLIVGIPRSGLLVASIIALKLGKPLITPDLFLKNHYWENEFINKNKKGKYKNILLVDDSITSGATMKKYLKLLSSRRSLKVAKAALIATKQTKGLVDFYYKIVPQPRIFEWNLLHAKKGKLISDLDGVICENCPPGIDPDEKKYLQWIKNAKPFLVPIFEIDVILSNRLEKYRAETQKWLAKHSVRYKKLILWNIQSKEERNGKHAKRKIEILLKIKPDIFWESSYEEAKKIWQVTKIPTLCINQMILFS